MAIIIENISTKKKYVLLKVHREKRYTNHDISFVDETGEIFWDRKTHYRVLEIDGMAINDILK